MNRLYRIDRAQREFVVIRLSDKRPVFYGSRRQCLDWIERNGHDEWQ